MYIPLTLVFHDILTILLLTFYFTYYSLKSYSYSPCADIAVTVVDQLLRNCHSQHSFHLIYLEHSLCQLMVLSLQDWLSDGLA